MAFTPVNEIERLLIAATRDPSARPQFYRALTEHDLLIIGEPQKQTGDGSSSADGKTSVQVPLIEVQGKSHVPIFTSKERVATLVKTESPFMAMNGRALFTMLRGADLVMNPGSEFGKLFIASEVDAILDGSILQLGPTQNLGGQQVLLSQPTDYPRHITDALSQFFSRQPQVKAAFLAQAIFANVDQTPHSMIGIDMTGDWKTLVGEAGLIVKSVVRPGEIIDFLQMKDKNEDGVSGYLRTTTPFYQRDGVTSEGA